MYSLENMLEAGAGVVTVLLILGALYVLIDSVIQHRRRGR